MRFRWHNESVIIADTMKTTLSRLQCLLAALLISVIAPYAAVAASQESGVDKTLRSMLEAIQKGSQEDFAKEGDEAFKKDATQAVVDRAKELHGDRLKNGYQMTYLTELKQKGKKVHFWKLTFKDNGDDLLVRVTFSNGKVVGFFFF
jgi:hypothetical protein